MSNAIEEALLALGSWQADQQYEPGHQRVLALLDHVSLSSPTWRIRVAGTNGKGSTAHMLAAALSVQGLRVGVYTSPHLFSFSERICIDHQPIAMAELEGHLHDLLPEAKRLGATYFEMATVLAWVCFSEAKVDVEILEAGVGARLDATTALPAHGAMITPIGLDHMQWLGDTLEDIAWEKAHAMKGCSWSVSALQEASVEGVLRAFNPGLEMAVDESWPEMAMDADWARSNASLALAAFQKLQKDAPTWDETRACDAIAGVKMKGRFEHVYWRGHQLWFDVAHNALGVDTLIRHCQQQGLMFDTVIAIPREDRNLDACFDGLRELCRICVTEGDVVVALKRAASIEKQNILVLGSFVTVAQAMTWIQAEEKKVM